MGLPDVDECRLLDVRVAVVRGRRRRQGRSGTCTNDGGSTVVGRVVEGGRTRLVRGVTQVPLNRVSSYQWG